MRALIRKAVLVCVLALACISAVAQSHIKVDAPGIVGADEQFNVTFIIDGEDKPSGFNWAPGDDFNLVWGPQTGSSTRISVVNGKRSKTSQYTYTYIITPKKTGKYELPAASAKIRGNVVTSSPMAIEVLANGSSSSSSQQSGGASAGSSGSKTSVSSGDLFL